jgi:hypothetical protein
MLCGVGARYGAAIAAVLLTATPASAAEPRVKLSRGAAEPGDRVVVAGHGFARTARLRLALAGRTLRRGRTGPRGGFRLAFRVPERTAGAYRLKVSVRGRRVKRRFRIRAVPVPAPVPVSAAAAPAAAPVEAPPPPPAEPSTLVAAGDIALATALAEGALGTVSVLSSLDSIVSVLLAQLVLMERLSARQGAGVAASVAGALMLAAS